MVLLAASNAGLSVGSSEWRKRSVFNLIHRGKATPDTQFTPRATFMAQRVWLPSLSIVAEDIPVDILLIQTCAR